MAASISSELTIGITIFPTIESKMRQVFLLKAAKFIFHLHILSWSEKYAFARCELIGTFSTEELVFTIIELAYEPLRILDERADTLFS
jgi:hypothetical protein